MKSGKKSPPDLLFQLKTWSFIHSAQKQGRDVILLYVLESLGSSPGREGFCMAVDDQGRMAGSIGGGIMEHKFVEMAKSRLLDFQAEISVHRQVHRKSEPKHQSGMICSGEQTILLYPVQSPDRAAVEAIVRSLSQETPGILELAPTGISFRESDEETEAGYQYESDSVWRYRRRIGDALKIHIVGGGHCSLALSDVMQRLGFQVFVYDDRPGLNTMAENRSAREKRVISGYETLGEIIPSDESHYLVIMTFGYRTDDLAVRALRGRRFAFFGLLGSRKKIEKMMEDYRSEGFEEDWLHTISAPVGLPIKSQTPEEIAISIAAEIIARKNKDYK